MASVDDPLSIRRLSRVIAGVLAAGFVALFLRGADGPEDPYLKQPAPGADASTSVPPTTGAP